MGKINQDLAIQYVKGSLMKKEIELRLKENKKEIEEALKSSPTESVTIPIKLKKDGVTYKLIYKLSTVKKFNEEKVEKLIRDKNLEQEYIKQIEVVDMEKFRQDVTDGKFDEKEIEKVKCNVSSRLNSSGTYKKVIKSSMLEYFKKSFSYFYK